MIHSPVDRHLHLVARRTAIADVCLNLRGASGESASIAGRERARTIGRDISGRISTSPYSCLVLRHQILWVAASDLWVIQVGAGDGLTAQTADVNRLHHCVLAELVLEAVIEVLCVGSAELRGDDVGERNCGSKELPKVTSRDERIRIGKASGSCLEWIGGIRAVDGKEITQGRRRARREKPWIVVCHISERSLPS